MSIPAIETDDIQDMKPSEMSRAQLVRAIKHWRGVSPEDELHDYVELLIAAEEMLEQETYHDGVGVARCPFCFQERQQ